MPELADTDISAILIGGYDDDVVAAAEIIVGVKCRAVGKPVLQTAEIDPLVLYNVLNANEFPFEAGVLFRHIKSFFVLRCRIGIFGALLCRIATFLVLIVHLVILAV